MRMVFILYDYETNLSKIHVTLLGAFRKHLCKISGTFVQPNFGKTGIYN